MREIRYADAGMDMKKLAIVFFGKCWLVLLAAVLGAVAGGVIYTAVHTVPESKREYRAVSKLDLDFAADETGEVYQAYNGYTWNDLMATDPIMNVTMSYLPEGYSREEVAKATKAEILSDLRLLTITVTTHDADETNAIIAATNRSLEDLGASAKEFIQIEAIQTTEAELVTADSRLVQAALVGTVIALFIVLLCMLLYYVTDDRIFVASDLKQVTDIPFLGYCSGEQKADKTDRLQQDYERNLSIVRHKEGEIDLISVDRKERPQAEETDGLSKSTTVVLEVPFGKEHASYLGYIIENLQISGRKIAGIAIRDADHKFLMRYYGFVLPWRKA